MATLLENFRQALIDEEVPVRPPDDAAAKAAGAHPFWCEPDEGAIAPDEVDDPTQDDDALVVSAFQMPGVSTGPYENSTYRFDNVELRIRCKRPPEARDLEELIRDVIVDRRDWMMGDLRIIESLIFLEMAPVGRSGPDGVWTFRMEYSLQRYTHGNP